MCRLICIGLLSAVAGNVTGAEDLVRLTMAERCGVARKGEYVTFGVPLPKGKIRSVDNLDLLRGSRPIPVEFLPVTRWWEDGSLRWVHAIFQSDCPANGSEDVVVHLSETPVERKQRIHVTDGEDTIEVDTGVLQFRVRKKAFNLIDSASIDGSSIIEPHSRGLGVRVAGREYLAALDPNAEVVLEESGPLHAVIHARGAFISSEGERRFDYDCRVYAYADSPNVRVVATIINRQGRIDEFIPLDAYFIAIPTTLENAACLFGSEEGLKTGRLRAGDGAFIFQSDSDKHLFGGALDGEGKGKSTKPDSIGWGGLSDGKTGLALGLKWFWQMHPKSVEVDGAGVVRAGLYPERLGQPLKFYPGVARTHEIMLAFGKTDGDALRGVFAGLQKPLRPFAPPKWYCRDTQSLGDLCEAGGEDLYGEFTPAVKKFDEAFEEANRRCRQFRDRRALKSVMTDSYGFLNYGDGVHYVWTPNVDVPENIAWDGNYYGYPNMMCVQFLRTGNEEYFENFEAHALHVADVHTVHYAGERTNLVGGCRYCPPTDHVRIDPKDTSDYKTARVYVSDLFNHHKVAGVIERWYFLRDHRCKDVADMVLEYCHRHTYGDNDFGQPRGPGMIMVFCADAYDLYGDKAKWAKRASNVLRVHRSRDLNLSFQAGIFLEGMRRYYEMSGDEEALQYIRKSCDRIIAGGGKQGGNTCAAMSFLYRKTGEERYLDAALAKLPQQGRFGNPWKEFGLSMRNAALCIGDLHQIAQRRKNGGSDRPSE